MKKTTRREFLKRSGFTLITVGIGGPAFLRNANVTANSLLTQAAALSANDHILVVIQLAGGNDSQNTVIPTSGQLNALYHQYRPTLGIPDASILPLQGPGGTDAAGNQLGFHPSMTKLQGLYNQGHVGLIQAVGYPNPVRSHFESMDIWHLGDPQRQEKTGWLGDYLDVADPSDNNLLMAASIGGGTLPLSLHADKVAVPAIGNIASYQMQTDSRFASDANNRIQTFLALNRESAPERVLYEQVRLTALDAYESSTELQAGTRMYTPDPTVVYDPRNPLATALQQAAQIIAADLGTKILYVTLGGFDTHTAQADPQARLLGYVSDAVDTFYRDLVRLGKDDKVLIMTWSEFSRKVVENMNRGTDHGAASVEFVFGTPVKGGIYGVHPGLSQSELNPGLYDTKFSIDFRRIYATVLEDWLGADSKEILNGSFTKLGFVQ
jgi:uncharacterized protein (DUF1501 family)